jgi:hypothetical protein
MRWALALVLLAGCDYVFQVRLPDGDGGDGGGPPDAVCDRPVGSDDALTPGRWLTADRDVRLAVKLDLAATLLETDNVDTTNVTEFSAIQFPNGDPGASYESPALAPGGGELFTRVKDSAGQVHFDVAKRIAGAWGPLGLLTLLRQDGTAFFALGEYTISAPTVTSPRRLMLSRALGVLSELVEVSDGTWQEIAVYVASDLGTFLSVGEASLVADGLALVFVSERPDGTHRLQVTTRDAPEDRFTMARTDVLYLPVVDADATPFVTVDCQIHLYYTAGGTTRHAILEPRP